MCRLILKDKTFFIFCGGKKIHHQYLWNNVHKSSAVVCRLLLWTGTFSLDPCLLYFWVQSQTNSMGLTARIKGLILRSSCCFFLFLQKPQGSGFIVFSVLSSLKITHKANNWFSCCLFPMRIQMSVRVHKACFFPPKRTSRNLYLSLLRSLPSSLLPRPTCCLRY